MGCDIHMYVEWRNRGCPWQADEHHSNPNVEQCGECEDKSPEAFCASCYKDYNEVCATGRNYQLFAAMAGVRGEGPEARGLPSDVSATIQAASDDYGDGHSHSWNTLEEFEEILKNLAEHAEDEDSRTYYSNLLKETSNLAWYSYRDYPNYQNLPPDYISVINYCKQLKELKALDPLLLGGEESDVEVRLVYWFDN